MLISSSLQRSNRFEIRLATISAIKRLSSHRVPIEKPHDNENCFDHHRYDRMVTGRLDDGSMVNGTGFNPHEQLAMNPQDNQKGYETHNALKIKSIENRLATHSAM